MRSAVFFDRDGTLIEHVHYLVDPAQVRIIESAPEAVRLLQSAGYACVVVTNQSVVGRGMLSAEGLDAVHAEMNAQFAAHGVRLDAIYSCTSVPKSDSRSEIEDPFRKPGPGMLLAAARDLTLNLESSWMVGDMLSDILAGRNAGCRGCILVRTGKGLATADVPSPAIDCVVDDVLAASRLIVHTTLMAVARTAALAN